MRLAVTALRRSRQVVASLVIGIARRQPARFIDAVSQAAYAFGMLANLAGAEYGEYRSRQKLDGQSPPPPPAPPATANRTS